MGTERDILRLQNDNNNDRKYADILIPLYI